MTHCCTLYGLGLEVNCEIAALRKLARPPRIDLTMCLGSLPDEVHDLRAGDVERYAGTGPVDDQGTPTNEICSLLGGRFFRITFVDGTVVVVEGHGRAIWAVWPEPFTVEDTAAYLLGPALGFALRLRGITCLHASAVRINGEAVVLVGDSGAGKSTMAAAFAKLGYAVMSDDVVPVVDQARHFAIQPAYPRVRLWPPSVDALFGAPDALPLISPNWGKRFLDLSGPLMQFQSLPLPLGAIYFIGDRTADLHPVRLQSIGKRESVIKLVANTYANQLLSPALRAQEFELLTRIASQVPIRSATYTNDISRIDQVCTAIAKDFSQRHEQNPQQRQLYESH